MTTKDFWLEHEGEWPACEHVNCELPAVVGTEDVTYECAIHGRDLFVFQAGEGEWFADHPDDVPWVRIGDEA